MSDQYAFGSISGTNITSEGNLDNTAPTFENLPLSTINYTYDLNPDLAAASNGENAATDGTDLGVFGGTSPFKLTGSVLPVVRKFILPSNIVQGTDATADIEVSGN